MHEVLETLSVYKEPRDTEKKPTKNIKENEDTISKDYSSYYSKLEKENY